MTDVEQAGGPGAEEDEDLEDGEIESDDDEDVPAAVEAPKVVAPIVAAPVKSVALKSDPSPPAKKSKANKFVGDDQEDFATSLERQLAQALGKPAPQSPHPDEEQRKGATKEDRPKGKEKNRKRKRRNETPPRERERDKNRKSTTSKKSKPDEGGNCPPEDMDDFEMLNVRGGSPAPGGSAQTPSDGNESDRSYSSCDSYESGDYHRRQRKSRNRGAERSRRDSKRREKDQEKRGRAGRSEGGRHNRDNGNDSDREVEQPRGRDVYINHPRKMELCKFYLMECCAKREKCLYMHQDFPCKYYYTQSECTQKDCKFAHGKPLTDALRAILMKHMETAPKEILGDFPRIGRELANQKIRSRHKELCIKFNVHDDTAPHHHHSNPGGGGGHSNGADALNIPPLNDIYSKPPPPIRGKGGGGGGLANQMQMDKNRKSRWCEQQMRGGGHDRPMTGANAIPVAANNSFKVAAGPPPVLSETAKNLMSLRNLTNVLAQDQIEKLAAIGIETLDQVKHLTVLQLTEIGLSIGQLSEIQMNAMQMEKTGTGPSIVPITSEAAVEPVIEKNTIIPEMAISLPIAIPPPSVPPRLVGDTDMRIVPTINQDVDMRFLGLPKTSAGTGVSTSQPLMGSSSKIDISSPDAAEDRMDTNAVVDYSQYLREANIVTEEAKASQAEEEEKVEEQKLSSRVLEDERQAPDMDDEDSDDSDDGLKICNDEEEEEEEEQDKQQDDESRESSENKKDPEPPVIPSVSYWPMASLTSLNKIDLSSSVTQMMNAAENQKKSYQTNKIDAFVSLYGRPSSSAEFTTDSQPSVEDEPTKEQPKESNRDSDSDSGKKPQVQQSFDPRDPRNRDPRNSRETPKSPPMIRQPLVVVKPSIYDWSEDGDEDSGSSRSPPLKPDQDMRLGDVDLRMPFKPMQNYVPATEIDGSISSHLPMIYKVFEWDVPKPNFKDIRRRVSAENSQDPRLKRIFGQDDTLPAESEKPFGSEDADSRASQPHTDPRQAGASFDPRMDPRRRKEATIQSPGGSAPSSATGLDIQIVLQKSSWYADLGSKNKILVNQQLAVLTSELKHFHEQAAAGGPRAFDVSKVLSPMLVNVLQSLGITVDEQGAIQPSMGLLGVGGVPPQNMNMNDANMMMPELAVMLQQQQQQQRMYNMNPALMHQMQGSGIRPGLLGLAPPQNLGFSNRPPQFDAGGNGPPPGVEMGNFMMNYGNDNMGQGPPQQQMGGGGGGGGFFPQQQQHQNNSRGNFRGGNSGRGDRWIHNNNNNGRRHNSRRD